MRCPGARRAPTVSSCAWRHTRAENSGVKGSRRVIISTGRVIMRNLLLTGGASIILPFPPPTNGQSLAELQSAYVEREAFAQYSCLIPILVSDAPPTAYHL